jgi:hypothetical protein
MFSMSVKQALDLWHQLTKAYEGTNNYGGDTAEIYGYTLGDWPPSMRTEGEFFAEYRAEVAKQVAENLETVLNYFCKKHPDVVISIDGVLTLKSEPIYHRVHVRVERRRRGTEAD